MENSSNSIRCDGCGLSASAEHARGRVERLELATRFRPIHINVLFVVSDPLKRREDDFYLAPANQEFFRGLMEALNIPFPEQKLQTGPDGPSANNAALLEFQRRGYYLTYLSECPLGGDPALPGVAEDNSVMNAVSRLASTLITRIRFNYKPKHVALLGSNLHPLADILDQTDLASRLVLDQGKPLIAPKLGDAVSLQRFREMFARGIPGLKSFSAV